MSRLCVISTIQFYDSRPSRDGKTVIIQRNLTMVVVKVHLTLYQSQKHAARSAYLIGNVSQSVIGYFILV
jgi:hypothetical protein